MGRRSLKNAVIYVLALDKFSYLSSIRNLCFRNARLFMNSTARCLRFSIQYLLVR
jgi:hypothetical protein